MSITREFTLSETKFYITLNPHSSNIQDFHIKAENIFEVYELNINNTNFVSSNVTIFNLFKMIECNFLDWSKNRNNSFVLKNNNNLFLLLNSIIFLLLLLRHLNCLELWLKIIH